jgi:hypothetical protein
MQHNQYKTRYSSDYLACLHKHTSKMFTEIKFKLQFDLNTLNVFHCNC